MKDRILIVDDDQSFAEVLASTLEDGQTETDFATNCNAAVEKLQSSNFNKAVVDLKIGQESGLQLIPLLLEINPEIKILMLTAFSSIATAVEAVKLGAHDYLCKPASSQDIRRAFSSTNDEGTNIPKQPHSVERLEWEHIQRTLAEHDGNISATARALGMHRRTLQRKLQKKPVER